jgi:arylformamidase
MLIDISQEVFSCHVFPGDPAPQRTTLLSIKDGAVCNLTALSMCAHNGTHVDAPYHFIQDGKTIDRIPLDRFVGPCWVSRHEGPVSGQDAAAILDKARENGAEQRILIAGKATVTEEAAQVFATHGVWLVGNESQTVGPEDAPKRVHEILLGCGAVLLEGLVLRDVAEGRYMLHAAPLNLGGSDGAPCRAYLISETLS